MRKIFLDITNEFIKQSSRFGGVQGAGNVTEVILSFDESWDDFAKTLTWFNAEGENPVCRLLTVDMATDETFRTYSVTIPAEALELWGNCSLVIEGYKDSSRAKSVTAEFEVEPCFDTSAATEPQAPAPTLAEQLQEEIEGIKTDIRSAELSAEEARLMASNSKNSADNATASEEIALASAEKAAISEQNAEAAADRAEQAILANGYAEFDIGQDGHLYLLRTPNIADILDFELINGRLEVLINE